MIKSVNNELVEIIDEAWHQYDKCRALPFVVNPSMPILFFGDYFRYSDSPLRIITVGLNPSHAEFPSDTPFLRFPQMDLYREKKPETIKYIDSLSDYYKVAPYRRWFNCYEPILSGAGSSYYIGQENMTLHTDICTPLATNPTWGRLQDQEKSAFKYGFPLWEKLISALEPDIILISVARHYLGNLHIIKPWEVIYRTEGKHPYSVEASEIICCDKKKTTLIFGQAGRQPFATISNIDKAKIGQSIKAHHIKNASSFKK